MNSNFGQREKYALDYKDHNRLYDKPSSSQLSSHNDREKYQKQFSNQNVASSHNKLQNNNTNGMSSVQDLMAQSSNVQLQKVEDREILKRLRALEQNQIVQEEMSHKTIELEQKITKIQEKFSRLDQYVDTLESNSKIVDNLKNNIDAKFLLFEQKIQILQKKFENIEQKQQGNTTDNNNEVSFINDQNQGNKGGEKDLFTEINSLYKLVRKSISSQKEMFEELTHLKRMMRSERENSCSSQLRGGQSGIKSSILRSNNNSMKNSSTLTNQIATLQQQSETNILNNNLWKNQNTETDSIGGGSTLSNYEAVCAQKFRNLNNRMKGMGNQDEQDECTEDFNQQQNLENSEKKNRAVMEHTFMNQEIVSQEQIHQQQHKYRNMDQNQQTIQLKQPSHQHQDSTSSSYSKGILTANNGNGRTYVDNQKKQILNGKSSHNFEDYENENVQKRRQEYGKVSSTQELYDKSEIERRKLKIDEEINRRLQEDRENRKRQQSNEKENLKFIPEKNQSSDDKNSYNSLKSRSKESLHNGVYDRKKLGYGGNSGVINTNNSSIATCDKQLKKWDFKSPEQKYYIQTNKINLK